MITAKEAEALIGATVVFVGRAQVSSDEIPAECRRYRCMRKTPENDDLIEEALRSAPSFQKLVSEPRPLAHADAVHMVVALSNAIDGIIEHQRTLSLD